MSDLTRHDPFPTDLDDLFKGFFVRPVRFGVEGMPQLSIKADISETERGYTVEAEMPGVRKEDIHVTIDGNRVSISAEVKKEKEEKKGEQVLRSERYYGRLERSFMLESDVDEAKAEAKYDDGVLKLMLPKKMRQTSKRLAVN